jgi:hypothetical protein
MLMRLQAIANSVSSGGWKCAGICRGLLRGEEFACSADVLMPASFIIFQKNNMVQSVVSKYPSSNTNLRPSLDLEILVKHGS